MIRLDVTDNLIVPLVPLTARDAISALWHFDSQVMSALHRPASEPALRQIRVRWWTQMMEAAASSVGAPEEPAFAALLLAAPALAQSDVVQPLADAYDVLGALSDDDGDAADAATRHGAALFAASALIIGAQAQPQLGTAWGQVTLARALGAQDLRYASLMTSAAAQPTVRASRALRALGALDALARSIALQGGERRHVREQLLLLRYGLIGR